jgi:hypothetical protein
MLWTVLLVGATACATPAWKRSLHDRYFQRVAPPKLHPIPETRDPSGWWERAWQSLRPLGEAISPEHHLRALSGGAPALDVNSFGQVPDSSWFVNRINRKALTPEQIRRGPNTVDGPAPGPLIIVGGKIRGNTPGLIARDAANERWVIKFDPPAFPEMASGSEIIATKLMHAAGYHVPQNFLDWFNLNNVRLAPEAKTVDKYNRKVPLGRQRLVNLITQLNPDRSGRVRALFSRYVEGTPIGPFSYIGTRADDPNDTIPHERRRSLRGLWVFAAWLNNTDTMQLDTLDSFIRPDPGSELGYVRHYLLDFNGTFGSDTTWPKPLIAGFSHRVDWPQAAVRLLAFGLYYPYWLAARPSPYRALGPFESEIFDPSRWRPAYPNPAFQRATVRDAYWAASILAHFDEDAIHAAVSLGRFSEPGAGAWLERLLLERRDKLLRYIFARVLPLDRPYVDQRNQLQLTDLAVMAGLSSAKEVRYRVQIRWNRSGKHDRHFSEQSVDAPRLALEPVLARLRSEDAQRVSHDPFLTVTWRREIGGQATGPRVEVHLRVDNDRAIPVGMWRDVD